MGATSSVPWYNTVYRCALTRGWPVCKLETQRGRTSGWLAGDRLPSLTCEQDWMGEGGYHTCVYEGGAVREKQRGGARWERGGGLTNIWRRVHVSHEEEVGAAATELPMCWWSHTFILSFLLCVQVGQHLPKDERCPCTLGISTVQRFRNAELDWVLQTEHRCLEETQTQPLHAILM